MTHPGIPMLALVPGQAPGTGAGTGYDVPPPPARRLDAAASAFDRARDGWLITRVTAVRPATAVDPGLEEVTVPASAIRRDAYDAWLSHVWTASACSRPVLLRGSVRYVDPATGEVTGTIRTDDLPDRVIYKPCGNRRATTCPGCAETYRRDAFHLIRAGLAGGKGIPESVAAHPARIRHLHRPVLRPGPLPARPPPRLRRQDSAATARPSPATPAATRGTCPHGRPLACYRRHRPGDPRLGTPLCLDCYDYPAHVVWNAAAGELWRRTKQDIERHLIQLAAPPRHPLAREDLPPVRLPHGKAAEYQARGAVHFHALLRLDGTDRNDPDAIITPPPGITAADLEDAIRQAAATVCFRTRPHPDSPDGEGWLIAWGDELDVRTVTDRGAGHGHRPGCRRLPRQVRHQRHRGQRPRLRPHHPRHPRPVRRPRRNPHRTAHRCLLDTATRGRMCGKVTYAACAAGRTCSASAATSSPKPAATPSPSPPSARPASPTAETRTPDPTTPIRTARPHRRRNHPHHRHLSYAGTGWHDHRRRPPRQHRRRPGPQTPRSRTRPARRRIRREFSPSEAA